MPTFYLDENVSLKIVPFVEAAGYAVVTYLDEGLKGERDDVHLFTARRNDWILVTYNGSDFILLHDALHRWHVADPHRGILVLPDNLSNYAEAQALDVFIAAGLQRAGALYEWNPAGSWIQRPFPPPIRR
ncbi:MAG: DUF5615 family PIN-like protein [Thermomicrobiales bacterium]